MPLRQITRQPETPTQPVSGGLRQITGQGQWGVEEEEHGMLGELGAGLGRGVLRVVGTPANLADIAGEAIGWEGLEKAGEAGAEAIEQYIQESPRLRKSASISGDIRDNPQLWADPRWYLSLIGEGAPTIASMIIPGMAAAKAAKVAGWGAKGIIAARTGGALTAGMGLEAGGAAEDVRQYEERTGTQVPIGKKLKTVVGTGVVAGSLEAVPIFNLFGGTVARKLIGRIITSMAFEGGTEGAQEIVANAFAKAGYDADRDMVGGVIESVIGGVLLGGGMGAMQQTFQERIKETDSDEVADLLEQAEKETAEKPDIIAMIDEGMTTGKINGEPFTPEIATGIIQEAYADKALTDEDLDNFREKYPDLRPVVNDIIGENVKAKIDERVKSELASIEKTGIALTDEEITAERAKVFEESRKPAEISAETFGKEITEEEKTRAKAEIEPDINKFLKRGYKPYHIPTAMEVTKGEGIPTTPDQKRLLKGMTVEQAQESAKLWNEIWDVTTKQTEKEARIAEALTLIRERPDLFNTKMFAPEIEEHLALPPGQGFELKPTTKLKKPLIQKPYEAEVTYKPIVSKSGKPFRSMAWANRVLKSKGLSPTEYTIIEHEGGYAIQRFGRKVKPTPTEPTAEIARFDDKALEGKTVTIKVLDKETNKLVEKEQDAKTALNEAEKKAEVIPEPRPKIEKEYYVPELDKVFKESEFTKVKTPMGTTWGLKELPDKAVAHISKESLMEPSPAIKPEVYEKARKAFGIKEKVEVTPEKKEAKPEPTELGFGMSQKDFANEARLKAKIQEFVDYRSELHNEIGDELKEAKKFDELRENSKKASAISKMDKITGFKYAPMVEKLNALPKWLRDEFETYNKGKLEKPTGVKTSEGKVFATKAIKPQATITRADLKSIFAKMKNISTGVDKDGNFFFRPFGKPVVTIYEVNEIEGYIDTSKGQIPVGSFLGNTIELKTGGKGHTADIGTAWHEYEHWMEANGILSNNDIKALDTALEKQGITPNTETRAEYVGDRLSEWQGQKNLRIKRVLKKIADFVNAIYEFVSRTRTARGVLANIETGKILSEKELSAVNQFAQDVSFSLKKAAKAITDNPNFVRWFGDSKVAEDGEPLVVYHGTTTSFSRFDKSKLAEKSTHPTARLGFYFVETPEEAATYTQETSTYRTAKGGNIIPVYLSLQNPLVMDAEKFQELLEFDKPDADAAIEEIDNIFRKTDFEISGLGVDATGETVEIRGMDNEFQGRKVKYEELPSNLQDALDTFFDEMRQYQEYDYRDVFDSQEAIDAVDKFKADTIADGYDGIIIEPSEMADWEELAVINYIAFEPTQIKSIYNTGAFGITEPDIMFQMAGVKAIAVPEIKIIGKDKSILNRISPEVSNFLKTMFAMDVYIVPRTMGKYGYVGRGMQDRPQDIHIGPKALKDDAELNATIFHEALHQIESGRWNTPAAMAMKAEWESFDWKSKSPKELKEIGFGDTLWLFRKTKVKALKSGEFFAEMGEYYLERPKILKKQAKPIFDFFEKHMVEETKQFATKPTIDYRAMLRRYQEAHTTPLVDEAVDKTKIKHFDNLEKTSSQPDWIKEKFGRAEKTLTETIGDNVGAFRKNWQTRLLDRLHPIKALGETAYMLHRLETGAQATMAMFMRHGKLRWEDKALTIDTQKQGFMPWLDSLGDDAQKLFYWMAAKRAEVLETEGREKWLDIDTRKKIFDWVGDKPKSEKSWKILNNQFQEFNKSVLDLAQQSGLINSIKRAAWEQEFYVPFYRIFEDAVAREEFLKGPLMGKKHISAQIKRLLGAEMKIGDPLENVIRNWSHLIHESVRNMARAEAYDYAQKNKIKSGMTDESGKLMPLIETVKASELNIYRSDKEKRMVYVTKKGDDNILSFQKNGRRVYFKVNDIEMFNALSDVNHRQFNGFLIRAFGQAKRWLTYGATFGPAFKVANMLRDSLHTAIISKSFIPFVDSGKGIVKALREDADYVKFMASGAGFGSSYIRAENPQALAEYINRIVKKEGEGAAQRILDTPKKMLDFWEKLGAASENAARVQLYTKRISEGESHLKAAFEGRDLMDFTMRGDSQIVQFLIRTVPFMNARAQGLYKLGRAAKQDPKSFAVKGAMLTMATLALWAINRDEDEWKELEDWDKRTYYHFWIGDKHYRIPKPFETGAIFSTVFEGMSEVMSGDEEFSYFVDVMKDTFLDTFAMNPIPQAVRPLIEQWSNKSFFTGRPIEGQSLQRLRPAERKTAWTSETMQLAGKLGVSPKRAEEIIRGYFSTFGMFLLGISDIFSYHLADFPVNPTKEIDDYPLLGRFIKERAPARHTKYQTEFYEIFREVDQLVATVNNYKKLGNYKEAVALSKKKRKNLIKRKGLLAVRKQLTEINAKLRRAMSSRILTAEQKRAMVDQLVERKNRITRNIYEVYARD